MYICINITEEEYIEVPHTETIQKAVTTEEVRAHTCRFDQLHPSCAVQLQHTLTSPATHVEDVSIQKVVTTQEVCTHVCRFNLLDVFCILQHTRRELQHTQTLKMKPFRKLLTFSGLNHCMCIQVDLVTDCIDALVCCSVLQCVAVCCIDGVSQCLHDINVYDSLCDMTHSRMHRSQPRSRQRHTHVQKSYTHQHI